MDERRDAAIGDALARVFVLKSRDVFLDNSDVTRIGVIVALDQSEGTRLKTKKQI